MPIEWVDISDDPCPFLARLRANGHLTRAQRMVGQMTWSELWEDLKRRKVRDTDVYRQVGLMPDDRELNDDDS